MRPGALGTAAYAIGSVGLLAAAATDALALAGRHLGRPFLGSIELVQAAVVIAASSAMIAATIVGAHASVHILTERLSKPAAARLARLASLLGALFFAVVVAGSAIVAAELWVGFERTELLGIPLRWLRLLWIIAAALICILFIRAATKPAR